MITATALAYNLALISGCAYLVGWRDWSPWWFVLVVVFAVSSTRDD